MDEIRVAERYDEASDALVSAFLPYIRKRASRIRCVGWTYDDIVQEGMIGLFKAVPGYEEDKGIPFSSYAIACIDNRINSALRRQARKKHIPLNESISLSEPVIELVGDKQASPEDMLILREEVREVLSRIEQDLSAFEKEVLALYLDGYSYLAISELLSSSPKSVDNALQRARKKLK